MCYIVKKIFASYMYIYKINLITPIFYYIDLSTDMSEMNQVLNQFVQFFQNIAGAIPTVNSAIPKLDKLISF